MTEQEGRLPLSSEHSNLLWDCVAAMVQHGNVPGFWEMSRAAAQTLVGHEPTRLLNIPVVYAEKAPPNYIMLRRMGEKPSALLGKVLVRPMPANRHRYTRPSIHP